MASTPSRTRPRRLRRVAALIGATALGLGGMVVSSATADGGPNLVMNSGFEDGLTGWSASGGTLALSDASATGDHG